ncbi:MAG: UDP-N-acetylmuramate dehydrogenase [Thermaerobacter sp.]|nr:UDP-N-acetylmuramate dehydrogenase [Thermaerobacter sp.]
MAGFSEMVPLAPQTTIGLGGPARFFAEAGSDLELRDALQAARSQDLTVQILGGGSNTVFADAGYPGLVLHIALRGITFVSDGDAVLATAAAGEDWDAFVALCLQQGLQGLECLSGIPGSVGATPIQNVGAYGQEISQTLVSLRALDRERLEEVLFASADCGFAYRDSRFKGEDAGRYVITEVTYRLQKNARPTLHYPELAREAQARGVADAPPKKALQETRQAVIALRRGKSMVYDPLDANSHSVGSFFLNPVLDDAAYRMLRERLRVRFPDNPPEPPSFPADGGRKIPAAWLIERAGFVRGLRRGGAGISLNHTLALVNYGGTTSELLELAEEIESGVERAFGVRLRPEPVIVPGG